MQAQPPPHETGKVWQPHGLKKGRNRHWRIKPSLRAPPSQQDRELLDTTGPSQMATATPPQCDMTHALQPCPPPYGYRTAPGKSGAMAQPFLFATFDCAYRTNALLCHPYAQLLFLSKRGMCISNKKQSHAGCVLHFLASNFIPKHFCQKVKVIKLK